MADDKIKVMLDTDIGTDIDDAVALAYLLSQPRCDLVGVTTVSGQADKRAEMVSAMCQHVGRDDVPIYVGCTQAMRTDILQKEAQQAAALASWPRQSEFPSLSAVEFMRQTIRANPGEIVLLGIGPLTNIGVLFALDPEIPAMLKSLVLMCGRFLHTGSAEWNAVNDPYATSIVYGGGCQRRPENHLSFGLDVTNKCCMGPDECRRQFSAKVLEPVRDFAEVWFAQRDQMTFHDPLAAACIFEPDICQYRRGLVEVSLSHPTLGCTVFRENADSDPTTHIIASEVDSNRFFEHYFEIVS